MIQRPVGAGMRRHARGGGVPPSILKNTERTLNPEQSKQVRDRLVSSLRRGEPFVTGNDWDFSTVTIPEPRPVHRDVEACRRTRRRRFTALTRRKSVGKRRIR